MNIACKTLRVMLAFILFTGCTTALLAQRQYAEDILEVQQPTRSAQPARSDLTILTALPHNFKEWAAMPEIAELKVFNPRETAGEAEVRVKITAPNGRSEARSHDFALPVVVVGSGWNTYTAADLFRNIDLEWFDGDKRRTMDFSDTLPEGRYILHVSLTPRTPLDSISSAGGGGVFTAVDLAHPATADPVYTWDADSTQPESISLVWNYPAEVVLPGFRWLVRVAEAPADGSTADMDNLPAVLERVVSDSTRLVLFNPASYFQSNRRYVWSVQPYSGPDTPVWSQPVVFALPPKSDQ